jgi:2-oxoisovalerate dehydrogenase E1 component
MTIGNVVRGFDLPNIYQMMFEIRTFEQKVFELRQADQIAGSVHLCTGQEVVPAVMLATMNNNDRVISTYRGHGWALATGIPVYEIMAEILGRIDGTNGGRAGSAYLSGPKYGFHGENSIVGAGLPIANGVALGLEYAATGGVVAVSFGDGATNQGATHEAIVFSIARKLPVVFVCENNAWSEMTPISTTIPNAQIYQRAEGYGMPAIQIDGRDIAALYQAATNAVERARAGEGPTFIEVIVPRIMGHYTMDIEHYRSQEDKLNHSSRDPLISLRNLLISSGAMSASEIEDLEKITQEYIENETSRALLSPLPQPEDGIGHVIANFFPSNSNKFPAEGKSIAYGLALNKALETELTNRPELVLFGEDVAIPGGIFGVTRNLQKKFGSRVFDTPISESAILGAAIGASLEGMKPVVEIMWMDFLLVAFDQIVNQAANVRYISRGQKNAQIVVRMQEGATPGSCAQHSQALEALIAHIPGIKVGLPATPHDAYHMLRAAIADPDPVVLIEARGLYLSTGILDADAELEKVGGSRLRRSGNQILIVTWGRMTLLALEAAKKLDQEHGISVSVLDLRWLNPLDEEGILAALRSSGGKMLILHEANVTGGFGAEISARIHEHHLNSLLAPILRLGVNDSRIPASPIMQAGLLPTVDKIISASIKLHASKR